MPRFIYCSIGISIWTKNGTDILKSVSKEGLAELLGIFHFDHDLLNMVAGQTRQRNVNRTHFAKMDKDPRNYYLKESVATLW